MINIPSFIEWFYNLFFNSKEKRNELKRRGHFLVYQNTYDYSDSEKASIVKFQKEAEQYNKMIKRLDKKYNKWLDDFMNKKQPVKE